MGCGDSKTVKVQENKPSSPSRSVARRSTDGERSLQSLSVIPSASQSERKRSIQRETAPPISPISRHSEKLRSQVEEIRNDDAELASLVDGPLDNGIIAQDPAPYPPDYDDSRSKSGKSRASSRSVKVISRTTPAKSKKSLSHRDPYSRASVFTPPHDGTFACPYCKHCRGVKIKEEAKASQPPWFVDNPQGGRPSLDMDQYDTDAIRNKIVAEYGHLPGCYDYQPYLTIEKGGAGTADDYEKQPFVAQMKPHISPTHTPFPNFDQLQRNEHRLNKPYSEPIFVD